MIGGVYILTEIPLSLMRDAVSFTKVQQVECAIAF